MFHVKHPLPTSCTVRLGEERREELGGKSTHRQQPYRCTNHPNVHGQHRARRDTGAKTCAGATAAREVSRETWADGGCATTRACGHQTDSRWPIRSTGLPRANSQSQSRKSEPGHPTECGRDCLPRLPDRSHIRERAFAETTSEHTEWCEGIGRQTPNALDGRSSAARRVNSSPK